MSKKQCKEKNHSKLQITPEPRLFSSQPSLEDIRRSHNEFCLRFNVDEINSKENTFIALMAELGQLAKLFKWRKNCPNKFGILEIDQGEQSKLEDVLADSLIYIVRIANQTSVDLPKAVIKKIDKNIMKYYNVKLE